MRGNRLSLKNRIWLKIILIGLIVLASTVNMYLNNRPKQSVSFLELSTLELLSEFDDY
ncbi:hypothetical protein [Larkinella terrae]|uniref:Uncharacterized protein n=1 Tax=Larkinella terrae TaxID=2025311 RepID=A0A7K0EDK9_9BACT|nr:hypothetical protein [Larkinella terrae]MRS59944.1 hypothetical protein [Larkinella terrae]